LEDADSAVALADSNGVDRLGPVDLFESETGVTGIVAKQLVGASGLTLNVGREAVETLTEAKSKA
jgi:hypothetical protein